MSEIKFMNFESFAKNVSSSPKSSGEIHFESESQDLMSEKSGKS